MLSLLLAVTLELGAVAGPPVYFTMLGLDARSTKIAEEACRTHGARCFETTPLPLTGNVPGAILVAGALSYVDYRLYKRNKWAAWGLRAGVIVGWGLVYRQNMRVAREVGR